MPDYYSHKQLAAELKISERTLSRLLKKGDAPPRMKIGRKSFYRKQAVEAWCLSKEVSGGVNASSVQQ